MSIPAPAFGLNFIQFLFYIFSSKKIVFLVPTVPLANQQASVFQKELNTKVFTGDSNMGTTGGKAGFDEHVKGQDVRQKLQTILSPFHTESE